MGETLGIIGYGSIGRETARLAAAFGMTVLALKRNPAERVDRGWCPAGLGDPEGKIPARFFGPDEREAILRESDYMSVTLPLTDHTRKFIGEREFAAMKPGAYLVNIGRGEVIDERAMATALTAGKIGGAGLDVFEHEPLEAESPLWDLENVILTPHISGANRGYMDKACAAVRGESEKVRRESPAAEPGRSQPRLLEDCSPSEIASPVISRKRRPSAAQVGEGSGGPSPATEPSTPRGIVPSIRRTARST